MTPVTGFVLLTGVGALFIWWLGFRMSRTGHAFVSHPEERKHHKAA
jgi:threonine/homoserine/homoserine lactone efflux protein